MTLALRAHHVLCLLTYAGSGYSPGFVANFDAQVARLAAVAELLIVAGPDVLCAPLCAEQGCAAHCHGASVRQRDRLALRALTALLGRELAVGSRLHLDADLLACLRMAFAQGRLRAACVGCPWQDLCSRLAAEGFAAARLQLRA